MPKLGSKHFSYSKKGIAAYKKAKKQVESIYTRLGNLLTEKEDWIKGAVKRPGRCTPMPNPDCPVGSPQYNLGKRFKKAGRREGTKAGGKTGWKGKV